MVLRLDRNDLKPEKRDHAISNTYFNDFLENVQEIIKAVGQATIFEWGNDNYNAISPNRLRPE